MLFLHHNYQVSLICDNINPPLEPFHGTQLSPTMNLRHPTESLVAYLVLRHRDVSGLTLPLNRDIYPSVWYTLRCVSLILSV